MQISTSQTGSPLSLSTPRVPFSHSHRTLWMATTTRAMPLTTWMASMGKKTWSGIKWNGHLTSLPHQTRHPLILSSIHRTHKWNHTHRQTMRRYSSSSIIRPSCMLRASVWPASYHMYTTRWNGNQIPVWICWARITAVTRPAWARSREPFLTFTPGSSACRITRSTHPPHRVHQRTMRGGRRGVSGTK